MKAKAYLLGCIRDSSDIARQYSGMSEQVVNTKITTRLIGQYSEH